MITIFGDFRRKNWRFLENQCYDPTFSKVAVFLTKNASIFANFLPKTFFKILTSALSSIGEKMLLT
jgi:hypothetical protein